MEQERTRPPLTHVRYGPSEAQFESLAGNRVADAFRLIQATLNVPDGVQILADGQRVDLTHEIAEDEVLEFVQEAGKKGDR